MKLLLALACAGLTGVAARDLLPCASQCVAEVASRAPFGVHVDARSASVFAGGCHANAEFSSQGESALLGWHLEGGAFEGVELAGVDLAAAVTSDANLGEGAPRRAVVYVDRGVSEEVAEAAVAWLQSVHGTALGEVTAVHRAAVGLELVGDRFELRVAEKLELVGDRLADRSCCTMPESIWYEPLAVGAGEAIVGVAEQCAFDGEEGFAAWSYRGRNNVFVAEFGGGVAN